MSDATTAPLSAAPGTKRRSWLRNPSPRHILIVAALLFVVVVAINVYGSFSYLKAVMGMQGEVVKTVRGGVPMWYTISLGKAHEHAGAPGFEHAPVRVLEAVPYGTEKGYAVLAEVPGVAGVTVGLLHSNNSFETVLADGVAKADLAVRPDGIALYTVTTGATSVLMQLDLTQSDSEAKVVTSGRSPRLFTDGFFVAITNDGLVRIDPVTNDVSVLIESPDAASYHGSISANGTHVAMTNTSGKTLVYRINRTSPTDVSLLSSTPLVPFSPLVFVEDQYVVEPRTDMFALYRWTERGLDRIGSLPIK